MEISSSTLAARVGNRDQPGADATVAFPPRPPTQLLRTNVITDRQSRHCVFPFPRPQHLLLVKHFRCNSLGESASTQLGISRLTALADAGA